MFYIYAYPYVCVCMCLCACMFVCLFVGVHARCVCAKESDEKKRHSAREGLLDCACCTCGCVIGYRHAMKPLDTSAIRSRLLVACIIQHDYGGLRAVEQFY